MENKPISRMYLVAIIAAYFITIYVSSYFIGYKKFWRYLGVSAAAPIFKDLRNHLAGLECHGIGYDVLVENPCDPYNRPMSYPKIWLVFRYLSLDQNDTLFLGVFLGLLFFGSVLYMIGPQSPATSALYGIILLSPAVILGVERGNSDLLIFAVLVVAINLLKTQHSWFRSGYLLILMASLFKLFPIFGMLTAIRESSRRMIATVLFLLATFVIYVFYTFNDLLLIDKYIDRSTFISYGWMNTWKIINNMSAGISNDTLNLVIVLGLIFLTIVFAIKKARSWNFNIENANHLDTFRLGAGIYIGTYLFWQNWDYRLMFLIFTIPQLLEWIQHERAIRFQTGGALVACILTLWLSKHGHDFVIGEFLNMLLFGYFLFVVLITLPVPLRVKIMHRTIGPVAPGFRSA